MTTRKDVARKTGVSVATVSYVLNNEAGVSEKTRQKVWEIIRELDYKPSYAARALSTKKTNHLTVLFNYLGDAFEAGILNRLEIEARKHGYFVNIQKHCQDQEETLRNASAGRIDGVFLLGHSLHPETLGREM